MLLTLFIVIGFKNEVKNKVIGFGSHIQIVNFDNNNTYQLRPIVVTDSLLHTLGQIEHVQTALPFCTKPGIIKTQDTFQGIVIKGRSGRVVQEENLCAGTIPTKQGEIMISKRLSNILSLTTGDSCFCYFIDENVRVRKYRITGLYDSQFSDFDELFVVSTFDEVQQLNGFEEDEASGIEILISDFSFIDETADEVYLHTANRPDKNGNLLYTETIEEQNPGIFAWLRLLDMNVIIILLLMISVSSFCIISSLIILILDGTQLIGTLKSLGADNHFIRKIFLYQTAHLIVRGLLIGNIAGLSLAALQYFFHIIPLNPATYYVSYVPIAWSWSAWLLLNIATIIISLLVLVAPSSIISRISPAQVMRFE